MRARIFTPLFQSLRRARRTAITPHKAVAALPAAAHRSAPHVPRRLLHTPHPATSWTVMNVFDQVVKQKQKDRVGARMQQEGGEGDAYFLKSEVAMRLVDRLDDVKRRFPRVLCVGADPASVRELASRPGVEELVVCDTSPVLLNTVVQQQTQGAHATVTPVVLDATDPTECLPFPDDNFDLVFSNLSLHWVNDLPGTFAQIHNCLVEDGLFMATMFGAETLAELRMSLQLAEMERDSGISHHVSPMADYRDMGDMLSRARFNLTMVDMDDLMVGYADLFALMRDLQDMGEGNAVLSRRHHMPIDTFMAAAAVYRELFLIPEPQPDHDLDDHHEPHPDDWTPSPPVGASQPAPDDPDPCAASFNVIFMTGWKPSDAQPQPLERGSADFSMHAIPGVSTSPSQ